MIRILIVILPLFLPTLGYMLYRYARYNWIEKTITPPQAVPFLRLFLIGIILVLLNVVFLVQFDGVPASSATYSYPTYDQPQN